MQEFLAVTYYWLKAGHIIFMIFWMAGLFMLPRFMVYHQEAAEGSDEAARWIERERRLKRIILTPSMVVTWVLGVTLAFAIGAWDQGWFHAKLLLVVFLTGYHGWMSAQAARLGRGEMDLTNRQLRLLNEVPGIAIAVIVVLVVLRPF